MVAAAAVLLDYGSDLIFFQDSWELLMNRRDFTVAALMEPHGEHIVLIPALLQQLSLRLFRMDSMTPDLMVLIALLLGVAACLFVYVRRRLGPWPALLAATLLLFLGPAWQDLLWPFQITLVGSALCGLAALLVLEGGDRRWDPAACALLILAFGFSSLGLPFAVAAGVEILLRRRERGLGRLYVVAVPLLLYAGWYVGWGHDAPSQVSADNVLDSPRYAGEGLVASLDALFALGTIFDEPVARSQWSLPLLIALLALVAYGGFRGRGFTRGLWPVLAGGAGFWLLAGFNEMAGREPYSSRYLYVGVLFLLLVAANLLERVRMNRLGLVAAGAVTLVVVGFNLVPLREGRDFFQQQTVLTRSDLGAIEIAAGTVEPGFRLPPEISGTVFLNEIEAAEYLRAVDEYGSPAYSPAELAAAPEEGRRQADLVLANALPLGIETGLAPSPAAGRCVRMSAGDTKRGLPLSPGLMTIHIPAKGEGAVRLRRFAATEWPLRAEELPAGSTARLFIPRDRSQRPWRLQVEPLSALLCGGAFAA